MKNATENEFLSLLQRNERGYKSEQYLPSLTPSFDVSSSRVKVLAYYLPQYHPFEENNRWWGEGFTEWTNVTKSLPQYQGHEQPHLPSDLGFYDLRVVETMEHQIRLAIQYGITGFCFYFYWFNGKRLLSRPLDMFLSNKELSMDYCLCWANENWTRRWDGSESEVLMGQEHSPESDLNFIHDLIPYLQDERYIKIDGRPVIIVYRVTLLPDVTETSKRWREEAIKVLGCDLFLVYAMTFGNQEKPELFGFDAAIQFPPHGIEADLVTDQIQPFRPDFSGNVFEYSSIIPRIRQQLNSFDFPVISAAFPSWDNSPRRGAAGNSFRGASADHYASWLSECASHADNKPIFGARYLIVNAWNEWAEGAHLEPDQRFGHSFLRATASVLRPYSAQPELHVDHPLILKEGGGKTSDVAVVVHAYYVEELEKILNRLSNHSNFDLFVTLSGEKVAEMVSLLSRLSVNATVTLHTNRGRDVRPFLQVIPALLEKGYKLFVKAHTKRTTHRDDGSMWFHSLIDPLFSLLDQDRLQNYFSSHVNSAMIAPAEHILDGNRYMGSAGNHVWLKRLFESESCQLPASFAFAAGSMFAGRLDIFSQFGKSRYLTWFEDEEPRRDGTFSHAFERFIGAVVYKSNMTIGSVEMIGDSPYCLGKANPVIDNYMYALRQGLNT